MADDPLRILLWSTRGAGLHYGGPGMTAYRLYRKADPRKVQVTLAHGYVSQPDYPAFVEQVYIAEASPSISSQYRFIKKGRRWLRDNASRFDVFHGLGGYDITVEPALTAQHLGLPAFVKLATYRTDLADKPGWKSLFGRPRRRRRLIGQLSGVIAISADIRDELVSYGLTSDKISLIPNGVDTEQFRPPSNAQEKTTLRRELGWPDMPILLFSGAINQRKRPHLLVEAMVKLVQHGRPLAVVLAGPDDDAEYLRRIEGIAQSAGLSHHLIKTGFLPDTAPLYRAADLFALPSRNEGMPNALLEAMASGLPSLVTDISGSRDLVTHDLNGKMIEPHAESIAHAIQAYLADVGLRATHGREARQRTECHFSTSTILDAHEQLFRQAIRNQ